MINPFDAAWAAVGAAANAVYHAPRADKPAAMAVYRSAMVALNAARAEAPDVPWPYSG